MDSVRIGVIGLGKMGQRHCRVYANLRRAQLVGVCDINAEVGRQVARQYDIPFYNQLDELLAQVDAVSLVTPTSSHFDLATHCLEQGIHVLVEKPMTETLLQAEQLARMAETSNGILQVGHIERFNPAYAELKSILRDMTVLAVNMRRLSAYSYSNQDVDVVLDLMIHDLDLALDLTGRFPTSVYAQGLNLNTLPNNVVDHATAQVNFAGGPLLSLTASRITEQKIRMIEVTALEAYLECDLLNKNIFIHRCTHCEFLAHANRGVKYRQESIVEQIHVPTFEPLFLELQHFVDCILENKTPLISARGGLEAIRLATAVQMALEIVCQGGKKKNSEKIT